jgi:hypothetical protein
MNVEFVMLAILIPLVVGLLTNEFSDWLPVWSEKIVVQTARALPERIRQRYEQDWLGDLDDHPTGFSKLRFAFGLIAGVSLVKAEYQRFLEVEYRRPVITNQTRLHSELTVHEVINTLRSIPVFYRASESNVSIFEIYVERIDAG